MKTAPAEFQIKKFIQLLFIFYFLSSTFVFLPYSFSSLVPSIVYYILLIYEAHLLIQTSNAWADTWEEFERETKTREERDRKQAEIEERENIAAAILNDQTYLEEQYLKTLTNQQIMRKIFKESQDMNVSSILETISLTKEERLKNEKANNTDAEWNWIYEADSKGFKLPDTVKKESDFLKWKRVFALLKSMSNEKIRFTPPPIPKIVDPPIIGSISESTSNAEEKGDFFDFALGKDNKDSKQANATEVPDRITQVPFLPNKS